MMKRVEQHEVGLIIGGGTLDKIYKPLTGELGFDETSRVPRMLERANVAPGLIKHIGHAVLLDSLDMTDEHRQQYLKAAQDAPNRRLVGTHGTDTIVKTAHVLGEDELLKEQDKTIVLTAAMSPESVKDTTVNIEDALFNLGYAVASAQQLDSGVYVAMNGVVHPYDDVWKNADIGQFEAIDDADSYQQI